MKKANAILVGDLHLMDRQPICRTDDFWKAQEKKINWLRELQMEHHCPVLCAGDVFDKWNSSLELVGWAIENLPSEFYTVYGQHDLPQHNMKLRHRSALGVLERAGVCVKLCSGWASRTDFPIFSSHPKFTAFGFDWNQPHKKAEDGVVEGKKVAVRHIMTYSTKLGKRFPQFTSDNAKN